MCIRDSIWFVDSDDFIAPGLLSRFYEKTRESHVDMLIFNNVAFEDGKCRRFVGFDVPESPRKTGIELYQDFYYNPVLTNRLIQVRQIRQNACICRLQKPHY